MAHLPNLDQIKKDWLPRLKLFSLQAYDTLVEALWRFIARLQAVNVKRPRLLIASALAIMIGAGAVYGTMLVWSKIPGVSGASDEKFSHSLLWRLEIYMWKFFGKVPELSWQELKTMTWPGSGFFLAGHVKEGRSLEGVVANPYNTPDDIKIGKELFSQKCGACHGADGKGRVGPALAVPHLTRGESDFILYKHIRDGIPGTAMPSVPDLTFEERWKVVGFVRSLMGGRFSDRKPARELRIDVSFDDILKARGNTNVWLTYAGALDGRRYSPLTEFTPQNAGKLRLLWSRPFATEEKVAEAVPLVVDSTIFLVEPANNVIAMEAQTGKILWRYQRNLPLQLPLCCGRVNRGMAILGDTLYFGTLDARLVALNAKTGEVKWEVEVGKTSEGYSITGAPLAVKDLDHRGYLGQRVRRSWLHRRVRCQDGCREVEVLHHPRSGRIRARHLEE